MVSFILLSGGSGTRMNHPTPKQYMLLAGKPVIMHTLERVNKLEDVSDIVLVCADEYVDVLKSMLKQYGITKPIKFASAGRTRQESVLSGLMQVTTAAVLIHEAARPFVKTEELQALLSCPSANATFGSPVPFTVLRGHTVVEGTLDRSELVNVQLPQKFDTEQLKQAHKQAKRDGKTFTEDASMLFHYLPDIKIDILPGTDYNIKLTTPTDMLIGERIYDEYFARRSVT